MPKFYFDFEDDGGTTIDESGEEFAGIEAAKREASVALADAARDYARHRSEGRLAIRVRDASGPILELSATFETKPIRR